METEEKPFIWKGKTIKTIGELTDALDKLTEDEAPAFRKVAADIGEVCLSNIGYCIGYFGSREKQDTLYKWLNVTHPIFGETVPTQEEAFAIGLAMGAASRGGDL